ncbi:MAG TPA: fibrillarin-like rRNA/tRNA 2'-O-methyltransferase [Candidatus Bathyarchaeia archaeon]|nr:fibrillarin-like rRNA/tRNA 2'-O-methyltransferase [Candidatus Bathyarchaeia archaeon]
MATLSLAPGTTVYGEETVIVDGREYRLWDPYRSKLAAAIKKGMSRVPIRPGSRVLYLGASSGTTASHVSDIVGSKGLVYCVEFAQRSFRDLVNNVCKERRNMIPIFEDARFPVRYRSVVQTVNAIYSDVAQPDQARILSENLDSYLEEKGEFLMAVKARSIDQSREPTEIYSHEKSVLETRGYRVSEMVRLDPFEKDHCMFAGSR